MVYLLDASHVKYNLSSSPDEEPIVRFGFELAVLRTCKRLNTIASETFHRNHFILVKTNSLPVAIPMLADSDVCTWDTPNIARFKKHRMSVRIVPKRLLKGPEGQWRSFLMCMESLPALTTVCRMVDLVYHPGHSFNIHVFPTANGAAVGLKLQEMLLEPFHSLQFGENTTRTINGHFDQCLAEKTRDIMQPRILWTRAKHWEFMELVLCRQQRADLALVAGDMHEAHFRYHELWQYLAAAQTIVDEIILGDDDNLRNKYLLLNMAITTNFDMVEVQRHWHGGNMNAMFDSFMSIVHQGRHLEDIKGLDNLNEASIHFCCGIGSLWLLSPSEAGHSFRTALDKRPNHPYYERGLEIAQSWAALPDEVLLPEERLLELGELMDMVPIEPIQPPINNVKSIIASLDLERSILDQLGYTGTRLEGQCEQKKGWSFHRKGARKGPQDPEFAERIVAVLTGMRELMNVVLGQEAPRGMWVNTMQQSLETLKELEKSPYAPATSRLTIEEKKKNLIAELAQHGFRL